MAEHPLSVTEAMTAAKRALEDVRITVVGEVSEFNDKPGYKAAYFSVSDGSASMPCLMWRSQYARSGVELRPGLLVELRGFFSAYVPKGRMQFSVESLSLAGEGDLRMKVARIAAKLEAEGLMASSNKRTLPTMPARIAVVTSPRGKAIHDVIRTLRRRYPIAELLVAGIPVEGEAAPALIANGIEVAAAAEPDVILLVRGGGSYEDLMPFNDETLARTIALCPVPIVTGIGHEPDTTIADMVSDMRASTPTAAAESVAPSAQELTSRLARVESMLGRALASRVMIDRHRLERITARPLFADATSILGPYAQTLDLLETQLKDALSRYVQSNQMKMDQNRQRLLHVGEQLIKPHETSVAIVGARLRDLSPLAVLERGYSIVYKHGKQKVVRAAAEVGSGDGILVQTADGTFSAQVTEQDKEEA